MGWRKPFLFNENKYRKLSIVVGMVFTVNACLCI
jgi:hypothetical protein